VQQREARGALFVAAARHAEKDERGITLLELLTGLMLFGMIASILYSFLFMGAAMYRKISVETQLRNQADALFGRIVTELKDAIYVKQGQNQNLHEIVFVKRSSDPQTYVEIYRMKIEQDGSGVTVFDQNDAAVGSFELTPRFKLRIGNSPDDSAFVVLRQNLVKIRLIFERADAQVPAAEQTVLRLESTIPLFRME